jgi:ribosomal protein S18 acetylase RimI-like enzyme
MAGGSAMVQAEFVCDQVDGHAVILARAAAFSIGSSLRRSCRTDWESMALTDTSHRVFQRGTWPGTVSLRRGWSRAEARPWNDSYLDAHLRMVRGGAGFLADCARRMMDLGAPSVLSTPLAASARGPWEAAGFISHLDLSLMRRSLETSLPAPNHLVVRDADVDLEELLKVDRAAFEPFWRFDYNALQEATQATSRSSLLVINDGSDGFTGYAVVGYGHAISYLQRVAVHPDWQGQGMGRSLIRAAARGAKRAGSKAMLLNTQSENDGATTLYESEGYVLLPESLAVLRIS